MSRQLFEPVMRTRRGRRSSVLKRLTRRSFPAETVHSHSVAISRLSTSTQFVATVWSSTTLPSGILRTDTRYSFASPFHLSMIGTGVEPRLLSLVAFSAPSKNFSHADQGAFAYSRWIVCIWRTTALFAGATSSICAKSVMADKAATQKPHKFFPFMLCLL